ncbi:hypothetical protein Bbelb_160380, partial [Branchiostoma belcheri]
VFRCSLPSLLWLWMSPAPILMDREPTGAIAFAGCRVTSCTTVSCYLPDWYWCSTPLCTSWSSASCPVEGGPT